MNAQLKESTLAPLPAHTLEPWYAPHAGIYARVDDGTPMLIADVGGLDVTRSMREHGRLHEQLANALRIIACVNACEGIATEALLPPSAHAGGFSLACLRDTMESVVASHRTGEPKALDEAIAELEMNLNILSGNG